MLTCVAKLAHETRRRPDDHEDGVAAKLKLRTSRKQTLSQTSWSARNNNTNSSAWGSFLFKLPAAVITVFTARIP